MTNQVFELLYKEHVSALEDSIREALAIFGGACELHSGFDIPSFKDSE